MVATILINKLVLHRPLVLDLLNQTLQLGLLPLLILTSFAREVHIASLLLVVKPDVYLVPLDLIFDHALVAGHHLLAKVVAYLVLHLFSQVTHPF